MESSFEWHCGKEIVRWGLGVKAIHQSTPWLALIGQSVSSIHWMSNENLALVFENGDKLIFLKGSEGYESFQITKDTHVWVF